MTDNLYILTDDDLDEHGRECIVAISDNVAYLRIIADQHPTGGEHTIRETGGVCWLGDLDDLRTVAERRYQYDTKTHKYIPSTDWSDQHTHKWQIVGARTEGLKDEVREAFKAAGIHECSQPGCKQWAVASNMITPMQGDPEYVLIDRPTIEEGPIRTEFGSTRDSVTVEFARDVKVTWKPIHG